MKKRKHNKFAIVVIFTVTIAFIGNLMIDNPYTHGLVNYYLNQKILTKLPIRAEYQSMKLELLPPSIQIYGLKISTKTPDDTKEKEIVSASGLSFRASLWSIFLAKPQIGDLEIKDLNLAWPPPNDLMTALNQLMPPEPAKVSKDLLWPPLQPPPVSSLKLVNATILVSLAGLSLNVNQDKDEVTTIQVDGLNTDVDIRDWNAFSLDINSDHVSLIDSTSSYFEDGSVKIQGKFRANKFTTTRFEVHAPRLNITGDSSIAIETRKNTHAIDSINVVVNATKVDADLSLVGTFLDITGNRGQVAGRAKASLKVPVNSNRPVEFGAEGHVQSYDARFYDFRLYETESDFKVNLDQFELHNASIIIGDKTVAKGEGFLKFGDGTPFNFEVQPHEFAFQDILSVFNANLDILNFDLTSSSLKVAGKGKPFNMTVTSAATLSNFDTPSLQYDHAKHTETPRCDLDIALTIDSKALRFTTGAGTCAITGHDTQPGQFPLNISGFAGFNPKLGMDLLLKSDRFNPAPLTYFSQMALRGEGRMATRIYGPYTRVVVDIDAQLQDLVLGSTAVGALSSKASIADGKLTWTDLTLTTAHGGYAKSPNGQLLFNDRLDIDLELDAKDIDHGIMGSAVNDLTNGQSTIEFIVKSAKGHFKGPVMKPLLWNGLANLDLRDLQDRNNSYAKEIVGIIERNDRGFTSDSLNITAIGSQIMMRVKHTSIPNPSRADFWGGLGLNNTDRIELDGKITAIPKKGDDLKLAPFIGSLIRDYGIAAEVSGDVKLAGTLERQTGMVHLQLGQTKIFDASVSDISAAMIVDGEKLDIMAEQGGSAMKARINLDLGAPNIPFNWFVTARNADLRPWLPSFLSDDARNFAYVSGVYSLQGHLLNWWDSRGELDIKDIRMRFFARASKSGQRLDFRSAHPTNFMFNGRNWSTSNGQALTIASALGEISLGLKDSKPPTQLGLTVDGKIDLSTLKMFVPDLETASGVVIVRGQIDGHIERPQVAISLKNAESPLGDLALGMSGFRPSLQNIELDALVNFDGITIKKFKALKGNGTISASGFIARPGTGEETDVTFVLDNAALLYPFPIVKYFDSSIDGQIKITGAGKPWTASGRATIRKARSNRDVDIREAILESLKSQGTSDATESISPMFNLDISIVADKTIGFSSRSGQATLSSDLRISGTNISPSIFGLVEVPKGRFFYKREFVITRGLINFDDPVRADPNLDISATSDVSSYRVGINITGRASNPSIDFTVDPTERPDGTTLTKVDIITLLSRGSLPDAQSSKNTSGSAAATEALNLIAGQVEDTVQKIFDLSGQNVIRQVYIDTYADAEGTPIARFNLPLNISDDFDVILKVDQSTVNVSSEYSLHDSISLTGGIESSNDQNANNSTNTTGTPADTAVDLKFKFAFP